MHHLLWKECWCCCPLESPWRSRNLAERGGPPAEAFSREFSSPPEENGRRVNPGRLRVRKIRDRIRSSVLVLKVERKEEEEVVVGKREVRNLVQIGNTR